MSCPDCVHGALHTGTPVGIETTVGGVRAYATGPADAARVLVVALAQMQMQLQNQPQALPWTVPLNTAEVRGELATLLFALTKLSSRFPLFGQHGLFPRPPPCAL